jgi:hypothetical protein
MVVVDGLEIDQRLVRDLDVTELASHLDVRDHGSTRESDLATHGLGRGEQLLHPVEVGREARHDDAPLGSAEDLAQRVPHYRFRRRATGGLGVGRVRQQQVHTFFCEFADQFHVGAAPVDRRVVQLEVAGVEDATVVGLQRDADRVGYRVGYGEERAVERADLSATRRLDRDHLGAHTVFVETATRHTQSQRRPEDRNVDLAQEPRQGPDVVFVTVRQHHTYTIVTTTDDEGVVR